jgi:hypothetical protein
VFDTKRYLGFSRNQQILHFHLLEIKPEFSYSISYNVDVLVMYWFIKGKLYLRNLDENICCFTTSAAQGLRDDLGPVAPGFG